MFILDNVHLGNALKSNPGYLKLRRIRAAQNVSNTVGFCLVSTKLYKINVFSLGLNFIKGFPVFKPFKTKWDRKGGGWGEGLIHFNSPKIRDKI